MARHEVPEGKSCLAVCPDIGDDCPLMLSGFAKRIFEQAASIADGIARNLLRAVEMSQGRIRKRREKAARHLVRPANGQGPLGITGYAAGDKGMGDADCARSLGNGLDLPGQQGFHGLLVIVDTFLAENLPDYGRFRIGNGQESNRSRFIF